MTKRIFASVAALVLAFSSGSPAEAQSVQPAGCVVLGYPGSEDVTCTYTALGRGGVTAATTSPWEVFVVYGGKKTVLASGTGPNAKSIQPQPGDRVTLVVKAYCGSLGICGTDGVAYAGV